MKVAPTWLTELEEELETGKPAMGKGDMEGQHSAKGSNHAVWLLGAIAAFQTLVVIVLGILLVSVADRNNDCSITLPDSAFPAATPAVPTPSPVIDSPDPSAPPAPYPDFVKGCKEFAAKSGFPEWQCPSPFPTYQVADEAAPECKIAVVGAGAGGLYSAMRLIDEGSFSASDVCVFEMAERVGGRLYSMRNLGPNQDLNVDAGGYRSWPQFTPTLHALITEYLGLPVRCYSTNEEPCSRFVIADGEGNSAGFTTFVETMMQRLAERGVRYFPMHEAVSLTKVEGEAKTTIAFANGKTAVATDNMIVNIPQRPLLTLLRNSTLPEGALSRRDFVGLHGVQSEIATKLYLYYPRAWWRELGLANGDFSADGDAQRMLLRGRYHDGDVKCTDPADLSTCHGFLLAVYAHDFSGEDAMYFRRFQSDRPNPVTVIPNTTVEGAYFLEKAHERLTDFHKYEGRIGGNYSYIDAVNLVERGPKPWFAVMATWNIATRGAGAAWHGWTDLKYKENAETPLDEYGIYTINEAYSNLQGWAEGSLMRADEVLQKRFGLSTPWSFQVEDVPQVLRQTVAQPAAACEDDGSAAGAGGSGGGGSAGGGGGMDDILCFTGDARLSLADGTTIALEDAAEGDRVWTGAGAGTITARLAHPVGATVDVAVVRGADGSELVGTLTHPVLVGGAWVELSSAISRGLLTANATVESRHVGTFYNLEIDGDKPGASPHAYVVNGVVASGNGDSPILNSMFPRQESWKAKAAAAAAQQQQEDEEAGAFPGAAEPFPAALRGAAMTMPIAS